MKDSTKKVQSWWSWVSRYRRYRSRYDTRIIHRIELTQHFLFIIIHWPVVRRLDTGEGKMSVMLASLLHNKPAMPQFSFFIWSWSSFSVWRIA